MWKRLLALAVLATVAALPGAAAAQEAPTEQPNVVFVLVDDANRDAMEVSPAFDYTRALIRDQGVSFEEATMAVPLCCPNRATMQRGQYPHNTRVLRNNPPEGGYQTFLARGLGSSTYATWVDAEGYATGYFGKYMNGYDMDTRAQPPGWDTWVGTLGGPIKKVFNVNGTVRNFAEDSAARKLEQIKNHKCKLKKIKGKKGKNAKKAKKNAKKAYKKCLANKRRALNQARANAASSIRATHDQLVFNYASNFISSLSGPGKPPFLAAINPYAPHYPAEHPASYGNMFNAYPLPTPPNFSEGDVSDKPPWVQNLDGIGPTEYQALAAFWHDRLRSMELVDRQVAVLVNILASSGELDNTYIVVASDNGFHMGHHRLPSQTNGGKLSPYSEDVNVPVWVRGPGIPAGRKSDALISSVDFAQTFADMTGAQPASFVDGRSFLPVAEGDAPYRDVAYSEGFPAGDAVSWIVDWKAVRDHDTSYHRYEGGEEELYDLTADPYQLDNLAGQRPEEEAVLEARLDALKDCKEDTCRAADVIPAP